MMTMPVKKSDLEQGIICACGQRIPATTMYRVRCPKCQLVHVVKGK